jgi:hypothetical protein
MLECLILEKAGITKPPKHRWKVNLRMLKLKISMGQEDGFLAIQDQLKFGTM